MTERKNFWKKNYEEKEIKLDKKETEQWNYKERKDKTRWRKKKEK